MLSSSEAKRLLTTILTAPFQIHLRKPATTNTLFTDVAFPLWVCHQIRKKKPQGSCRRNHPHHNRRRCSLSQASFSLHESPSENHHLLLSFPIDRSYQNPLARCYFSFVRTATKYKERGVKGSSDTLIVAPPCRCLHLLPPSFFLSNNNN